MSKHIKNDEQPVIVRFSLSKAKRTPSPSSVNFSCRKSFQKENMLPSSSSTKELSGDSSVCLSLWDIMYIYKSF